MRFKDVKKGHIFQSNDKSVNRIWIIYNKDNKFIYTFYKKLNDPDYVVYKVNIPIFNWNGKSFLWLKMKPLNPKLNLKIVKTFIKCIFKYGVE